ncbi:MAG TPA: hypothetical protein VJJ52_01970 [Candidatus Nanoarchaeia archaeon]|nr:hypothetical protein [Candidatus Nanoarchaeia archaeon]
MRLEDELELVNIPTEEDSIREYGAFKIVQLYIGGKPIMVFGRWSTPHFVIIREFLESRGVDFRTIHDAVNRIPSRGGDGMPYKVAGAGHNSMYAEQKRFTLPEGGSTFHGEVNVEHSAIFERRMINDGWTKIL